MTPPSKGSNVRPLASSRREFLKSTGRVAAASALAGVTVPHCHAAETSTIKLALVGCGSRGSGAVADALASTGGPVKLYAMADIFENRQRASHNALKTQFGDKVDVAPDRMFLGFDAYKKAIDCLGPGDVVMLTTCAAFRPLHFEYAVKKGVNVFMEKSFAVDSPGVRRMLKAVEDSERKNLKVAAGFMWRHSQGREEVNEPNPYHVEWQLLLDAIRQNKPHNEGRRAAEADLVALMGRTAVHTGQLITWDEMMKSNFQYVPDIDQMTFDTPAPIHAGPDGMYACPLPGSTNVC